jgi:hypothetical protein
MEAVLEFGDKDPNRDMTTTIGPFCGKQVLAHGQYVLLLKLVANAFPRIYLILKIQTLQLHGRILNVRRKQIECYKEDEYD